MFGVSTAFKTAVTSDSRAWKGKVIIDGITFESELINLTFEDKLMAEEGIFSIGQSVANYVNLTLQGVTGNFDGKKVEPFLGLEVFSSKTVISNFVNKISGSLVENPNLFKGRTGTTLGNPTLIGDWIEQNQTQIDRIKLLNDGLYTSISTLTNTHISQYLFSFNIIEILERNYGVGIWQGKTLLADKIVIAKSLTNKLTIKWHGWGSSPTGNKATLYQRRDDNTWQSPQIHTSGTTSLLQIENPNNTIWIMPDGFTYFLVHGEPSNGTIPSVINTDFVELTLEVNPTIEYVPLGTFYVDSVEQDYNSVDLSCFDSMIQFNFTYNPIISFPTTITTVINDLCAMVGVTFLGTLPNVTIPRPNGMTARDLIGYIAGISGGNATFDRNNKLVIRQFTNPNTDSDLSIDGRHYFTLKRGNGVYTIGKVTGFVDDITSYSTGALTNETRELIIRNPFLTQSLVNDIGAKLIGLSYYPFTMDWRGNPSLETGDNVTIDEYNGIPFKTVVLQNLINFNGAVSATTLSPLEGSIKNEFGSATNVSGTRYTWFKYADDENGLNMSDSPLGKKYLGLAYNKTTIIESNNPTDYSWSLLQGTPLYTWTKYADDENGLNMSDEPEGKQYLGIATNKESPIESTNPLDYKWSSLYGDISIGGVNLVSNTDVPQTKVGEGSVATNWYLSEKMTSGEHTISFDYDSNADSWICVSLGYNGTTISPTARDLVCQNIDAGTGTYTATFNVQKSDENTLILYTGGTVTIENLKLETGNVATDWSLSQEDLDNRMGDIETSISTQNNEIALKVSKGNLISEINASIEGIKISAPRVDLSGYATFTALGQSGATIINGDNIQTGKISAEFIEGGTLSGIILYIDTEASVGTLLNIGTDYQDSELKEIRFNGISGSGNIRFDPSTLHLELQAFNTISFNTSYVDFNNVEIRNFKGVPVFG